jgi:hypothetical protein
MLSDQCYVLAHSNSIVNRAIRVGIALSAGANRPQNAELF